jgi:hypothetical protein
MNTKKHVEVISVPPRRRGHFAFGSSLKGLEIHEIPKFSWYKIA